MVKGFGIGAILVALLAIVMPGYGIYAVWFSLILIIVTAYYGDVVLSIIAIILNIVNVVFLSPLLLFFLKEAYQRGESLLFLCTTASLFILPIIILIFIQLRMKKNISNANIIKYDKTIIQPQGTFENTSNQRENNLNKYKFVPENSKYPTIDLLCNMEHTISVGRNNSMDIIISNEYISGEHIKIVYPLHTGLQGMQNFHIIDMNSTNGTYIEGRRLNPLEKIPIREGQRIILGSEEVVYTLQQA